jgi:YHS domain-containing protein
MAKDSVCKMNVDESKTQYISEINGQKVFFVVKHVKENLTKILKNMDIDKYCKCYNICYPCLNTHF